MSRSGQEIVYCSRCSRQVRGVDFEKGKAFRVDNQILCQPCCPPSLREAAKKSLTSSRTAIAPAPSPASSSMVRRVPTPPPRSGGAVRVLGAVVLCVLILGLTLLFRNSPTPNAPETPVARESAPPNPPAAEIPAPDLRKRLDPSPAKDRGLDAPPPEGRPRPIGPDGKRVEPPAPDFEVPKREPPPVERKAEENAPPPNPVTPARPSPAPEPFRPEWGTALAPTRARDFQAALLLLRNAAASIPDGPRDLELLGRAADLHREALSTIGKLAKGQKVSLAVRGDSGLVCPVEGAVLRVESGRIVVRRDSGVDEIEIGEIMPSSFAALLEAKGKPADSAPLAVSCLLEGQIEAARQFLGDQSTSIPERYWVYAKRVAESQLPSDPVRSLYSEALKDLGSFETTSRGVEEIQALLRDHAGDPFVVRNKSSLADRAQGGRDFVLLAEDLRPAGALKGGKGGKAEAYWTLEGEPDPAKPKENYLEAVFSTVPSATYKCWVLAGGCCQETFEFSCQGSELPGPLVKGAREPALPGSAVALPVRPWIPGLKKTHSGHTGPKHPTRWEWVPVPLPKYRNPGPERLRVIFEQKGFAIAGVVISATRNDPPLESELKEWIRSRADRPRVDLVPPPKVISIVRCLFDGTDRRLVGNLDKGALYGTTQYDHCFLGLEPNEPVTVPTQGELRVTYFLKSATKLSFRLRIMKGADSTVPCDFVIENPAVDVATEVRIPCTEFRASYLPGTPAVVPGDKTPCIYIFGEAPECGLRVDALSLVEIRLFATGSPAQAGGSSAWKPIFDGQSLQAFSQGIENAWRVQNGVLVHDNGVDNACQTANDFGDGDIRFRFELKGVGKISFTVRQDGTGGAYALLIDGGEIAGLQGGDHELIFSCRGDSVTATLDGKPRPVERRGRPRSGRIQFNAFEGIYRLKALDYREAK
jgi:hypothetical protein